jgi:hypothetical protein
MSDKVYIVTAGEYSDYRIVRVYLDRQEAEEFSDRYRPYVSFNEDNLTIEEWEVGCSALYDGPGWRATRRLCPDEAWTHGEGFGGWTRNGNWWENGETWSDWLTSTTERPAITSHQTGSNYVTTITAEGASREHVEKAVQDAAAQFKAERAGVT